MYKVILRREFTDGSVLKDEFVSKSQFHLIGQDIDTRHPPHEEKRTVKKETIKYIPK